MNYLLSVNCHFREMPSGRFSERGFAIRGFFGERQGVGFGFLKNRPGSVNVGAAPPLGGDFPFTRGRGGLLRGAFSAGGKNER